MQNLKLFFQAFFIYLVVDIGYQLAIGFKLFTHFAETSGLSKIYIQPTSTGMVLMLLFFMLIAFSNLRLCILPAIDAKSPKLAMQKGALLGTTAYATLGFTNAWGIDNFPLAFALTITLEGLFFSLITSGLTTWLYLRKADAGADA